MRLWLVRHGETEANVAGLYSGHAPTPLTERGIAQAQTLGTLLRNVPVDNVLCSELERARHTTQLILAEREVPVRNMPELNEMFLVTGKCVTIAIWRAKTPKITPCGVTTGRMRRPPMAKVFRRFPSEWNVSLPSLLIIKRAKICWW